MPRVNTPLQASFSLLRLCTPPPPPPLLPHPPSARPSQSTQGRFSYRKHKFKRSYGSRCRTFQQHSGASQTLVCLNSCTSCHAEIEVADETFRLTQSQYSDTGPTSPSADSIMPGAFQGNTGESFILKSLVRPHLEKDPRQSGNQT